VRGRGTVVERTGVQAKRIAAFELRSLWAIASDVHQRDRLRRYVWVVWRADADMQSA